MTNNFNMPYRSGGRKMKSGRMNDNEKIRLHNEAKLNGDYVQAINRSAICVSKDCMAVSECIDVCRLRKLMEVMKPKHD